MIVFRVESDRNGIGPHYNENHHSFIGKWIDASQHYDPFFNPCHPYPNVDIKGWNGLYADDHSKYRFGFSSLRDLRGWFSSMSIGWYDETEFSISMYEVPDYHVLHGTYQVAFFFEKAVKIGSFKPG